MKTPLFSALAFSACASVAFADSLPPAAAAGPVALTAAEMDQVTAAGSSASDDLTRYTFEREGQATTSSPNWPPDDESRVWALEPTAATP